MSEETNVTTMENEQVESPAEEVTTEETVPEEKVAIADSENPMDEMSMQNVTAMLKQAEMMLGTMRSIWESDMREYKVNDSHMKLLHQWNEQHREPMPEGLTEKEQEEWDLFNGLDSITEEEVIKIFGEGHQIIGVDHSQTIDRIKAVNGDFFGWLSCMKEYRQIHDAYLMLIEAEEEKNIEKLRLVAEAEQDPEKKAKLLDDVESYYRNKYLDFLADPMDKKDLDRLVKAFTDSKKIEYWLNRTRDKLKQLKISSNFILETSQFEKRFLEEKYHKCSNILLLYFMQTIIYCDAYDKKDVGRMRSVCMVFALDNFIRNQWKEDKKERVLNNVRAFCDQIIDMLPEPKEEASE